MVYKIAVLNEKGGVGKTTTAVFLGTGFAKAGKRVLMVDLDKHAGLTRWFSIKQDETKYTIAHVLLGKADFRTVAMEISPYISIIPSDYHIANLDVVLPGQQGYQNKMKENMGDVNDFDYVIFDCPPSLNASTLNTLMVSDLVIIPTQTQYLSVDSALKYTVPAIKQIQQKYVPELEYRILITMYDQRIKSQEQFLTMMEKNLGDKLFDTVITTSSKVQEYQLQGFKNAQYPKTSQVVSQYSLLAKEIILYESGKRSK